MCFLDPMQGTAKEIRATEAQAIARAYRQGQTRKVTIVRFIIRDTIEHETYLDVYGSEDKGSILVHESFFFFVDWKLRCCEFFIDFHCFFSSRGPRSNCCVEEKEEKTEEEEGPPLSRSQMMVRATSDLTKLLNSPGLKRSGSFVLDPVVVEEDSDSS